MRKPFHLLFTLVFLISCVQKESKIGVENLTVVNLNFKYYNPSEHKSFVDVTIENLINPIEQQLKISDNGTATYTFINPRKTELIFNYENREFSLIASPKERIDAELNIKELLHWSKFKDYKITGKNAHTNNLIIGNTFYLDSLIEQAPNAFSRDGSKSDIDFKNERISEMKSQLQTFENFIAKNRIDDKSFIAWGKAQIKYRAGNELSFFPYYGSINRDMTDDSPYFSFVQEIIPESNNELMYQSYLKYLQTLSTSFKIMSNVSDKYKSEREQLKKDSATNFPILFNIIKQLPISSEREIIMAYAFQKNKQVPDTYQDSLQYFVSENLLDQLKTVENIEYASITSLIENYNISKKEKDELLEIYKGTKDKVVFHDFWFASCAPCIKELPNYNDLISTTDEDVVFIFYGVYMNESEWKETRERFDLKGRHHLLTKNQLAFFEKYFRVHGFPHHQLLNSKGQIVEETIQGVYPNNFEYLKGLIRKHKVLENNGA